MESEAEKSGDEKTWPGVESAQAFIVPSYQWMLTRIESADSRIQALIALVATVTFAVPALAASLRRGIAFDSEWLIVALVLAVLVMTIGIIARGAGGATLANPMVFYERWLHKPAHQFQRDALYFAGQSFAENAARVRRKAEVLTFMTLMFALELVFLAVWMVSAAPA